MQDLYQRAVHITRLWWSVLLLVPKAFNRVRGSFFAGIAIAKAQARVERKIQNQRGKGNQST